jgi:hypothetical protein
MLRSIESAARSCLALLLVAGCGAKADTSPVRSNQPAAHCYYGGPYAYVVHDDTSNGPQCPDLASANIWGDVNYSVAQNNVISTSLAGFEEGSNTVLLQGGGQGPYDPVTCASTVSWQDGTLHGCRATAVISQTFDVWGASNGTISVTSSCTSAAQNLSCSYTLAATAALGE